MRIPFPISAVVPPGRVRRSGGGRPSLLSLDPELTSILEGLVDPLTRGDPESPLRWTNKSTRALAAELGALRHPASHEKVAQLFKGVPAEEIHKITWQNGATMYGIA